jgi:hypothetical protein
LDRGRHAAGEPSDLRRVDRCRPEGAEPPSAWLANEHWPTPVLVDDDKGTAAQAWGLPGFPYFVLVGADGKVKLRLSGEVDTDSLTNSVNQALA